MRQTSKTAGFTITETLIVVAVAGLILLLVLQAVPILQRNSRNNQRKQDIQTILEGISHWELNHSGTIPDPATDNFLQFTPLHFYAPPPTGVTVTTQAAGASVPVGAGTDLDRADIYNHKKCDNIAHATPQGAGYYDVVALYAIETTSGTQTRCQQL